MAPFKIDLHVHTGRYSQCAEALDPYQIAAFSLQAGLAGVVLVEHDMFWQDEELQLLQQASPGIKLYRGIEVSARDCHLVVIGVEEPALLERGSSLEEVADWTHRQNGVVILAHPYRDGDPENLPVQRVDAVEVASTSFTREEARLARELAVRFSLPTVAASDAHALSCIGWGWTELPFLPVDESALARAIRSGAGRASVPDRYAGDPKEL